MPLGGRQVVVAGDPFQLEPIKSRGNKIKYETAFESRTWYLCFGGFGNGVVAVLGSNHRKSSDRNFYDILTRVRLGTQTPRDIEILNASSRGKTLPPKSHTRICLRNQQVSEINELYLRRLPGKVHEFECVDTFMSEESDDLKRRLKGTAPNLIRCKVGSRVIVTRIIGDILPGRPATVLNVTEVCEGSHNKTSATSFRLELHLDDEESGEDTLGIIDSVSASPGGHYNNREETEQEALNLTVGAQMYPIHQYNGEVVACRQQLPIISAYAMTVHRSQGMTLSTVAIDFTSVDNWRPYGMVYVALSRCTTMNGLWV